MTLAQLGGLSLVYFFSVVFVLFLTYKEFRRVRFNFNVFFSLLFLLTFYFGFPLTCMLVFRFDVTIVPVEYLLYAQLSATAFYAIYYVTYKTRIRPVQKVNVERSMFSVNRVEAHLTWILLALIAIGTVGVFFMNNGFLLFKLHSYSQIFSSDVSGVALKRFFYFFIPAMLVVYFLKKDQRAWLFFLVSTVAFGILTYVIVGEPAPILLSLLRCSYLSALFAAGSRCGCWWLRGF